MTKTRTAWAAKVGRVFTTNPRVRDDSRAGMWFPRRNEEKHFAEALLLPGLHICLDGPTGTGKSSLALSQLVRHQIPFVSVQVTHAMTWAGFCEEIILPRMQANRSTAATEVTVGFDQGLPTALWKRIWGENLESSSVKAAKELSATWTEHDIARNIEQSNVAVLVDDMETANDEILTRLAGLCRVLAKLNQVPNAKCIIVGTGDVFRRLYQKNTSLEERLREISLGTLPGPNESWDFLQRGFNALDLYHPGNSKLREEREQIRECIRLGYEAADGLPKSLNRLGQDIANRARLVTGGRFAVSAADIKAEAQNMPERNWGRYSRDFPALLDTIVSDETTVDLIKLLFRTGIGRIHHVNTFQAEMPECTEDQLDNSIEKLVQVGFLTRTGMSGNVIYASQPTLAHTLGVLLANPDAYPRARKLHERSGQLLLGLPIPKPSLDIELAKRDYLP